MGALGTAYHHNLEFEKSNIYLELGKKVKEKKLQENLPLHVSTLIAKNDEKIKKNNNRLSKAFSKSLSGTGSSNNNELDSKSSATNGSTGSRKHRLSPTASSTSPSKKKIKPDEDGNGNAFFNNNNSGGKTGNLIIQWCQQNKNLVYLGAAVVSLGAAYTLVMMKKKQR